MIWKKDVLMKHEQLVVLDAIVTTGTFRGASEHLNKSQSAVSTTIRLLEEEVNFQLFDRAAYRPVLTREGEVFYREALRVLHQMRNLQVTAGRLRAHEEAELRLALSSTVPLQPILDALVDVGARYPATHIRLATESMGGPVARLMEGNADIAIASLSGVAPDLVDTQPVADITIRPLGSAAFVAQLGSGFVPRSTIQNYVQIVVAGTGGQKFDQSRDLIEGGKKWTVSDFDAKKQAILAGLGWGGMPDHLTRAERAKGTLVPMDVEGFPTRQTVLHAIRRRDTAQGVVANAFWDNLTGITA